MAKSPESLIETRESSGKEKSSGSRQKPPFIPAKDDTKPTLRDPILRSDPIDSEQAVLRLPPFPKPQEWQSDSSSFFKRFW